jgi:mono/diheme cytochrome c family protein
MYEERSRSTVALLRAVCVLSTLGAVACTKIGAGPEGPDQNKGGATPAGDGDDTTPQNGDGDAPPQNGDGDAPPPACQTATADALSALDTYCASCHGPDSAGKGGFRTVLDVGAMIADGKIVPDDPAKSSIYVRMSNSSMPPQEVSKRPSQQDIQAVKNWIACGAPEPQDSGSQLTFTDINTRLRAIRDDLYTFENPTDRLRMRYIDLSNYANAGHKEKEVETYRQAVSFAVNSLSLGRNVIAPEAIDAQKLIWRIDLRDYGWSAQTWNLLEAEYPYAVIYDDDSRLFPFDEVSAEQIRDETGTQIPYLQGEWFLSHAIRPPLYFQILQLPDTLQGLEAQLGIDIQNDIDTEQVIRSGFVNAGPSQFNRVIERHELNGNQGSFWLSYDFKDNLDLSNIFTHPLDFQEAGGEVIFNLDNGMQAYFVINNQGARFDKAPVEVVQDPLARDGAVETGLSCMNCHMEDGMLPKYDEIRDFVLNNNNGAADVENVLALYASRNTLQSVFADDQNIYKTARAAAGISALGNTTIHSLDNVFLDIMHINDVAAVLGVSTEDFERALDASPQAFPPDVVTLRNQNGAINRDSFEAVVDGIITGLGLGAKLDVNAGGN